MTLISHYKPHFQNTEMPFLNTFNRLYDEIIFFLITIRRLILLCSALYFIILWFYKINKTSLLITQIICNKVSNK